MVHLVFFCSYRVSSMQESRLKPTMADMWLHSGFAHYKQTHIDPLKAVITEIWQQIQGAFCIFCFYRVSSMQESRLKPNLTDVWYMASQWLCSLQLFLLFNRFQPYKKSFDNREITIGVSSIQESRIKLTMTDMWPCRPPKKL